MMRGMDEPRKTHSIWPWTIRAVALSLPVLFVLASGSNFNVVSSPISSPVFALLVILAIIAWGWFRE